MVALALAGAGCGDDDEPSGGPATEPQTATEATAPATGQVSPELREFARAVLDRCLGAPASRRGPVSGADARAAASYAMAAGTRTGAILTALSAVDPPQQVRTEVDALRQAYLHALSLYERLAQPGRVRRVGRALDELAILEGAARAAARAAGVRPCGPPRPGARAG